jgi:Colicin V production protein
VPRIETSLLLDVLLGLVVLLFIPFGIRRGAAKEAMVSAGILLGATLADRFASQWGSELAARFALEPGVATFATSAMFLFAGTFLLGYGGGAALGPSRPGTLSRLVGGLLAAFNAALLLSYLVAWIARDLRQGAALDEGIISTALLHQADFLLFAAAGVLIVLTVLGWIVNAIRSRRQPYAARGAGMAARQRPVRFPSPSDTDMYDPQYEPIPRSGRFGQNVDATSPLSSSVAVGANAYTASVANGHSGRFQAEDDTRHRNGDARHAANDAAMWSAWSGAAQPTATSSEEATSRWPVASATGVTDDDRCAVCRAPVGPRDVFCPECGATL